MAETSVQYQLLTPLGEGGMGEVWLALRRQSVSGRPVGDIERVALKRIKDARAKDSRTLKEFDHEAQISSLLRHENVVRVIEHGVDSDGPFLALEFIDGVSLRQLLNHARAHDLQLPSLAALAIVRDSARALAYAHHFSDPVEDLHGVVHRDVSPDNLLVAYSGISKLVDFGLAMAMEGLTPPRRNALKGKYPYFAPELFKGAKANPATDRFAFAVTCFELFTGQTPFPGQNPAELLESLERGQPLRLAELRPDLPAEVAAWVQAGLSAVPEERPPLDALLAALDVVLGPDEVARAVASHWLAQHREGLKKPVPVPSASRFSVPHPHRASAVRRALVTAAVVLVALAAGAAVYLQHDAATASVGHATRH